MSASERPLSSSVFQRLVLPGLAFKAVIIGGGYATGREMASFLLPSGTVGGLMAGILTACIWSSICALTFLYALKTGSQDYRSFFLRLLGPLWGIFEVAWVLSFIVALSAFGAAAGAIGANVFGLPPFVGTLSLVVAIGWGAAFGNESVEAVFKYVSFLLYGTYALFLGLCFTHFGNKIVAALALGAVEPTWMSGGVTYAGLGVIGAIMVLPVTRHLTSSRDAIYAGLLAGPLAIVPGLLFFLCMCAFGSTIGQETLPSDFLLDRLHLPAFRVLFQLMICAALVESGTGGVHALNERIAHTLQKTRGRAFSPAMRVGVTAVLMLLSSFFATKYGLVRIVADGYRWFAYIFLIVYVLPLLTVGIWQLRSLQGRVALDR